MDLYRQKWPIVFSLFSKIAGDYFIDDNQESAS